ncbi:MAG: hypothetical protein PHV20_13320 [Bacteroidales bacterium]|nr:hypothetical protein [Bacteroidales bacterium]
MNKSLFLLLFLVFFNCNIYSQDQYSPWTFELSTGKNEYRGDRGIQFFKGVENLSGISGIGVNKDFFEIGVTRYLTPNFDVNFQYTNGEYGFYNNINNHFSGTKSDYSLMLRVKSNNGRLFSREAFIAPFATVGFGLATYSRYENIVPSSFILPIGVGIKIRLSAALSLQYQLLYNFSGDDKSDQLRQSETTPKSNNGYVDGKGDNFLKQTFGLVLNFGNLGKSSGRISIFDNVYRNKNRKFNK